MPQTNETSGQTQYKSRAIQVSPLIKILHRDENLVVIDKPSGLLVHRSELAKDPVTCLELLREEINRYVYPIHRLDRKVSGPVMFGLNAQTAQFMGNQLASNKIQKTYLALVRGTPIQNGCIVKPLKGFARPEDKSRTDFENLETFDIPYSVGKYPSARYSLLKLHPITGRYHQLRRHLSSTSHPIVGDTTYGKGEHNRLFRERFFFFGMALHCTGLRFICPTSRTPLEIISQNPPWEYLLRQMKQLQGRA